MKREMMLLILMVFSTGAFAGEDCNKWEDKNVNHLVWNLSDTKQQCRIANALELIAERLNRP